MILVLMPLNIFHNIFSINWLFPAIATGITSFVATNIDDMVILMLFFSQVNDNFRPKHIITGQYLGFTVLIFASLPGFFGALIFPKAWLGLLGLVPIAVGIKQLLNRENDAVEVQAVSGESNRSSSNRSIAFSIASLLSPQTYNVAAVTVANGGDNIGIYVPLFASSKLVSLVVILSVFYLLIGVWCVIAYLLTRHPVVANIITSYGNDMVPFVLIGLGIFILIDSGTYRLIPPFQ